MKFTEEHFGKLMQDLTEIGIALSSEKDHSSLLELILMKAQAITHADGGSIYTTTEQRTLKFEIMINKSMSIHLGGTSDNPITFNELPLYDKHNKPNKQMLAPWAALSGKTINIKDVYQNSRFDLSGTKDFDKMSGYHSQSVLTVPLTNHLNENIGVLQLVNAMDKQNQKIIPFSKIDQHVVASLASQAAITLSNRNLINAQKKLFDALIQLIANAIDEKSPYTGGHCRRVPVITRMIAEASCQTDKGPLRHFKMTDEELYELDVAAWLHDCGKITTPEAVVDKATKLEGIFDTIHWVDTRFEVLKRDAIIKALQKHTSFNPEQDAALQQHLRELDMQRDIVRQTNIGGEFVTEERAQTIRDIANQQWIGSRGTLPLLSAQEVEHLNIHRGTLSTEERQIINNHVNMTIKLLESLPYPKHLKNVPSLAGSHHEKMDGTGYPRGLKKEQMSLPARMIAIADVFEALTASDRPYKKSMPLQQALTILGRMKLDGHIDPDLFDVFINARIYERYAKEHLDMNTIDVNLSQIPGYKEMT
jgi:HD-GYP domain-containing protein (c-di-GMP phosphodiesterase class II)